MTEEHASTPPNAGATTAPANGADLVAILGEQVMRFAEREREIIERAYLWAREAHEGQFRCSGEPYLSHPVAVARKTLAQGLDWQVVAAALLHDTVEDTRCTPEDLEREFPDPIPNLVAGVTNISSLTFRSSHEEQVENLRKMVLAMAKDIRVVLIKLADRLHNMETLEFLPPDKQKKIARSTMDIYAPLAGRLGIYRVKSALEDSAMRYLYPDAYEDIARRIARKRDDRERLIERSVQYLSDVLHDSGIDARVTGRSKHFWSIFQKMRKQGLSFEEIYDLNALRVICEARAECYSILGIIHSIWKPVPEKFFDYIAVPKPNLYQSIHTKVVGLDGQLTEIQVRTEEMHRTAEEGIAAHWLYKGGKRESDDFQERLNWLRQMVEWCQDANDPDEMLRELKRDAFDDKIYCFTPKGDVIELPREATVLDFAYRIHTDLGHRCTGGKVNQKFVPLRHQLRMGDLVEIQTSKHPHPSPDWVHIVTTARARAKIRHALKQINRAENVQLGREMVVRALIRAGAPISPNNLNEVLHLHLTEFHCRTVDDLFAEVGFGTISTSVVVARLLPAPDKPSRRRSVQPPSSGAEPTVLVDGLPGSLVRFARCCRPRPGDPIVGFVTIGRGISIHHRDCRQLDRWLDQSPENTNRFVPVSWSDKEQNIERVDIRITCKNRTGVLHDITEAILSLNLSTIASNSRVNPQRNQAILRFTILIPHDGTRDDLMHRLRQIPSVESVDCQVKKAKKSS